MTLAELVDNRRTIFQRPSTKREIIRGRKTIIVNDFRDIVQAHEQRKEDEAVIISSEVDIIPVDKDGNPLYYSHKNFSKRGQYVRIPTFGVRDSMENEWSSLKARIEASLNPSVQNSQEHHQGWYWRDPEGYTHTVQPWMVLEGRRLEMYSLKSADINDKIEIKKTYSARDTNIKAVRVRVPSRSGAKKHDVILEHMTAPNDPQRFVEWMRFKTRHECGFKTGDLTFKYDKLITYCPHDVAAQVAYSRRIAEEKGRIIDQPFPLFSEPIARLYLSLIYDTIKVDSTTQGKRSRPLSFSEINPVLMHAWKTLGNKPTFYNGPVTNGYKSMRDYNWTNSAPGMPFKKA